MGVKNRATGTKAIYAHGAGESSFYGFWRPNFKTPKKVLAIHRATSSGHNSKLMKALKKFAPPSPLKDQYGLKKVFHFLLKI